MLRTAGSIPVGTAKCKQKNRLFRAVFLLFLANFCVKTGVKKSYAPRVPFFYEPAITDVNYTYHRLLFVKTTHSNFLSLDF